MSSEPAPPSLLGRAGVTAREAEVLGLVGARLRNREIADRLVLSVRTVESHVSALLRKLSASTRDDLVRLAAEVRRSRVGRRDPPRPMDAWIVPRRELAALEAAAAAHRLVTLVGAPGVGKTRLAVEYARTTAAAQPAVYADLAAAGTPGDVAAALLEALAVTEADLDRPAVDVLIDAIADDDVWLLLDTCEHVADDLADLLRHVMAAAGRVRVLATSQRPLHVAGEVLVAVEPLTLPDDTATSASEMLTTPAVRLFLERARAADPAFDPATSVTAIAALCRRLDGLPLAIELAAGRARALTPHQLLTRIDDSVVLVEERATGRHDRHRTLATAVAWSVDLLRPGDREVLARLTVFPGDFMLPDIEAIAATPGVDVTAALSRLVDRSLVASRPHPAGTRTYRLLDSIRTLVRGRLDAPTVAALQRRHAEHVLRGAAARGDHLLDARQRAALDWYARHRADLRAAMRWAMDNGEDDAAWGYVAGVHVGWEVLGIHNEVFAWLDHLLAARWPSSETLRVRATSTAALLLSYVDGARASRLAESGVALADRVGDAAWRAGTRVTLGWVYAQQGDRSRAVALLRDGLHRLPRTGHTWQRAFALQGLGRALDDPEDAIDHLAAAARTFAALGDHVKQANTLYMMANMRLDRGHGGDEVRRWLTTAGQLAAAADSAHEAAHVDLELARLEALEGAVGEGHRRLEALLPALRRLGDRRCVARCQLWMAELDPHRPQVVSRLEEAMAIADATGQSEISAAAAARLERLSRP